MKKENKSLVQRNKHNKDLIDRMRQGDSLQSQTASDSWFPPRPIIKKNDSAMRTLYSGVEDQVSEQKNEEKVVDIAKPKKARHLKLA